MGLEAGAAVSAAERLRQAVSARQRRPKCRRFEVMAVIPE
jgi:hypothetical protein